MGRSVGSQLQRLNRLIWILIQRLVSRPLQVDILGIASSVRLGSRLNVRHSRVLIRGSGCEVVVDDRSSLINCRFSLVGDCCRIAVGSGCLLQDVTIICEDTGSSIELHQDVQIFSGASLASTEGACIRIGPGSMIAPGCSLRSGDSHAIYHASHRVNPARDVKIGAHCWLAERVIVLKGASVADGSVVGAGSVVTKAFKQINCILAGVPARVLKSDIRWTPDRSGVS